MVGISPGIVTVVVAAGTSGISGKLSVTSKIPAKPVPARCNRTIDICCVAAIAIRISKPFPARSDSCLMPPVTSRQLGEIPARQWWQIRLNLHYRLTVVDWNTQLSGAATASAPRFADRIPCPSVRSTMDVPPVRQRLRHRHHRAVLA